jgi:sensor histidine kinase YesM
MTLNDFIFSNQQKFKVGRHFAFWLAFSLHFVIQNLMIGGPGEGKTSRTFLESFLHFLYFLPIYLLSTYFFIEVILPKFLYREKWIGFIVSFLVLFTLTFSCIYYAGVFFLHNTAKIPYDQVTFHANKYHALVDGMFLPFMLFGIAAGIKFSKKWFVQQRKNEKLAQQKLTTELQLLKTSIHPRFLIHSLRTVEKHIENSSTQSPVLILQLSELMIYILYENDQNCLPLEKEFEILICYIKI